MSNAVKYLENLQNIVSRLMTEQLDNIENAARAVADMNPINDNVFARKRSM